MFVFSYVILIRDGNYIKNSELNQYKINDIIIVDKYTCIRV